MPYTRSSGRSGPRNSIILIGMILLVAAGPLAKVEAGHPEYMELDYKNVPALEFKGYWDTTGIFVATDIEELPQPRQPKVRGEIQQIDLKNGTVTMYGVPIEIYERTQFLGMTDEEASSNPLKVGQRVEISCKIDEDGTWKARKIKTKDIKSSDKIKGSITRVSVDGNPPDTVEINGLKILLVEDTDVNEPGSYFEQEEFRELNYTNAEENSGGLVLGDRLHLAADYRQTVRAEDEYDLSNDIATDHNDVEPEVRLELSGYYNQKIRAFFQLRMRRQFAFKSDRTSSQSRDIDAGDTQLYILARDVGLKGLALKIGRQDVDEEREWLFDEYLDAVRVFYYRFYPLVLESSLMHSVAPLKEKIKTWTDVFAQVRWYFNKHSRLRGYFLLRRDSDELRNREPVWWGIGYYARIHYVIRPWFEIAMMRGEDKHRPLRATALDLGSTFVADGLPLSPSVTLGYAVSTGDRPGDQIDNEFRQTGYEDNVGYFGGIQTVRFYGEVLDPELSNLKILTLGVGSKPTEHSSVEAVYHSYKQHRPDDKLRSNLIDPPARPNGLSTDIGWELDFILGVNDIWQRLSLSWVVAFFKPGDTFSPFLEDAILNRFSLKIDL